jgi:4-hydroxybenzoate polyprenyltransferase
MDTRKSLPDDASHFKNAYKPPSTGILSYLPTYAVPYVELMRLSKPGGYFAFLFPHVFGVLYASRTISSLPSLSPAYSLSYTLPMLVVGTIFLRGAACTWNDYVDRDYDRQVSRCRNRPLARNAISPVAALAFLLVQAAIGAGVFLWPLPPACRVPAAALTTTQLVYPFCKRLTNYPQVFLGVSLSLGHLVGAAAALGVDLHNSTSHSPENGHAGWGILALSSAGAINTVIYDTVYGHQDLKDDLKANVKSLAVAWRANTKRNCSILAVFEIALLAAAGFLSGNNLGPGYYFGAVAGTAMILVCMLRFVDLESPESCMGWFNRTIFWTGAALCIGLWC